MIEFLAWRIISGKLKFSAIPKNSPACQKIKDILIEEGFEELANGAA